MKINQSFLQILFLLTIISCGSPLSKTMVLKNDLVKLNLKGNVKSTFEKAYELIKIEGGNFEKGKSIENGTTTYFEMGYPYLLFNEEGNIIEKISYSKNIDVSEKVTLKYNLGNQKLLESRRFKNERWNEDNEFIYNEEGILMEYLSKKNEEITFRVNYIRDKNKPREVIRINKNKKGKEVSRFYDKYDKLGNRIEEVLSYEKRFYEYDENGLKQQYLIEDLKGKLKGRTNYKYDEYKNLIESNRLHLDSKKEYIHRYKYKYDEHNNWIEKIRFSKKHPEFLIIRKIEYYK